MSDPDTRFIPKGLATPWSEISLFAHSLTVKVSIASYVDNINLLKASDGAKIIQTPNSFKFLQ